MGGGVDEVQIRKCSLCGKFIIWVDKKLVWPELPAVKPSKYLPAESLAAFEEAQKVIDRSPQCACAMLRLALERLCVHLGADKGTLKAKIESLGLDPDLHAIAEACRAVGNDAVHAGLIDYGSEDSYETARTLSLFINHLAERLIGLPLVAKQMAARVKRKIN